MRFIFFFFTLFILLLAELGAGTLGLYIPLCWMGFFYFAAAQYNYKLLLPTGIIGSFVVDMILFHRPAMPDIFIMGALFFITLRYKDFLRSSIRHGGIFGIFIIFAAYILQFLSTLTVMAFSWQTLTDSAAIMITILPLGYIIQSALIYTLDLMQKKMKFESSFIAEEKKNQPTIYRRSRRFTND